MDETQAFGMKRWVAHGAAGGEKEGGGGGDKGKVDRMGAERRQRMETRTIQAMGVPTFLQPVDVPFFVQSMARVMRGDVRVVAWATRMVWMHHLVRMRDVDVATCVDIVGGWGPLLATSTVLATLDVIREPQEEIVHPLRVCIQRRVMELCGLEEWAHVESVWAVPKHDINDVVNGYVMGALLHVHAWHSDWFEAGLWRMAPPPDSHPVCVPIVDATQRTIMVDRIHRVSDIQSKNHVRKDAMESFIRADHPVWSPIWAVEAPLELARIAQRAMEVEPRVWRRLMEGMGWDGTAVHLSIPSRPPTPLREYQASVGIPEMSSMSAARYVYAFNSTTVLDAPPEMTWDDPSLWNSSDATIHPFSPSIIALCTQPHPPLLFAYRASSS